MIRFLRVWSAGHPNQDHGVGGGGFSQGRYPGCGTSKSPREGGPRFAFLHRLFMLAFKGRLKFANLWYHSLACTMGFPNTPTHTFCNLVLIITLRSWHHFHFIEDSAKTEKLAGLLSHNRHSNRKKQKQSLSLEARLSAKLFCHLLIMPS